MDTLSSPDRDEAVARDVVRLLTERGELLALLAETADGYQGTSTDDAVLIVIPVDLWCEVTATVRRLAARRS